MEEKIKSVIKQFQVIGDFVKYETITTGHINNTYLVVVNRNGEDKPYILQRINTYVFKNPVEVMENIASVTEYIRKKIKDTGVTAKRHVLHYQKTNEGKYYFEDEEKGFWRCYRYIDNSITFDNPENLKVIMQAGQAFGEFQCYLADYPVETLHIAIPDFHNTNKRFETFKKSIEQNLSGRAIMAQEEISEFLKLEDIACELATMQARGDLPTKVTHNDTKCNNVLFDKNTFDHLAVLDLDTVMPGLVAFDFGDAIRFIANTANEDEKNVSKVAFDINKYSAFTEGFIKAVGSTLTTLEKETMAQGAIAMTVECGIRFLTDFIDGDKYFKVAYPEHNLVRCRTQLALAKDMIAHFDKMKYVVKHYCDDVEE